MTVSPTTSPVRIGVLTSGGDAPGMNAAVRAVVRSGLNSGAEVYAVREGWLGAVTGADLIEPLGWDDVSGILHRGGTIIGTARCSEFREYDGRQRAVHNLVLAGIDRLAVIGGDGTLTGANELRAEWPEHVAELLATGAITTEQAQRHPALLLAGIVGSIDNDLVGTDMTIGTDSALHRITGAIDAIVSTAASHQRAFIIEVMGRHCGYLALMGALAGGADYAFLPEAPPPVDWPQRLCSLIRRTRHAGRRDSIIVVAEGAIDHTGAPITCESVREALREHLGQDARTTRLGHVQRGGTPSAYDRWMASMVAVAATDELLAAGVDTEPVVIGVRRNAIVREPLMRAVEQTRHVGALLDDRKFGEARAARGAGFQRSLDLFRTVSEADPTVAPTPASRRIAVLHCGGLAPGMNTAVWAACRLGIDRGHVMLGVRDGFTGLLAGDIEPLNWGDVDGWNGRGGAALGTNHHIPSVDELPRLAGAIRDQRIDGLIVIGGFDAYEAIQRIQDHRGEHRDLQIPIALLPASIDNDLPGWKMSIGADSALNVTTGALDRIKQAASAHRSCVVVETMGRGSGFLAVLAGLAAGAERVYLNEDNLKLGELSRDVDAMRAAFAAGRRFYLVVRNEAVHAPYPTQVLARLFASESAGQYGVDSVIIGPVQQGPDPTPFDRMSATRLAGRAIDFLTEQFAAGDAQCTMPGDEISGRKMRPLAEFTALVDTAHRRPVDPWWRHLRTTARKINDRQRS
ncbi:6-phosphofructokinase [Cumulibacter soli]|uniref:6-phosphofructokinase n=1 Tax=Cumulibacter soli TaxID=2546344 RepID=UPI001ABB676B|nr:6-phosphofructokinase [Cumulibacter soli]